MRKDETSYELKLLDKQMQQIAFENPRLAKKDAEDRAREILHMQSIFGKDWKKP